MKKKIKIIDLLCLISVGEEVPKKIKYDDQILTFTGYNSANRNYQNEFSDLFECLDGSLLNDEAEILDEEDKDIPLIPDDELIILKQEKAIDMQKAIDFNFKVLEEKINQLVEEFNEFRKGE